MSQAQARLQVYCMWRARLCSTVSKGELSVDPAGEVLLRKEASQDGKLLVELKVSLMTSSVYNLPSCSCVQASFLHWPARPLHFPMIQRHGTCMA